MTEKQKQSLFGHNQAIVTDAERSLIVEARDRMEITFISMSPDPVFIGGKDVTVENGFPLPIGVPVPIKTCEEIWGIARVHGSMAISSDDRPRREPTRNRVCFIEIFPGKDASK